MQRRGSAVVWRYRRGWAFIAVGLLLVGQVAGAAVRVTAAEPVTAQTPIARTEQKLGRTDAQRRISLAVSLAPNVSQQGMEAFIADLTNPKSPSYHKYLTSKEWTARFIDVNGRKQVADYLQRTGLSVKDTGVGSVINATGTAAQVEQAFAVTLNDYKDASGKTFYASDKTPALLTALKPYITAVAGLDNAVNAYPQTVKPGAGTPAHDRTTPGPKPQYSTLCAGAQPALNFAYAPNELATAYNFDSFYNLGLHGEGQTVALFELSNYADSDLAAFKSCVGNTTPVTRVYGEGAGADFTGEAVVSLDADVVLGMEPNLGSLLVYIALNTGSAALGQYQKIANDDLAQTVNTSWGNCEANRTPDYLDAENVVFYQMAAQGQGVFAAAGDTGSEGCLHAGGATALAASDPAIQPFVTGVGGTLVTIDRPHYNRWLGEQVWNTAATGASGGGLSAHFGQPGWVQGAGTAGPYANGKRQTPDIAAPADPASGYVVYHQARFIAIGGTGGASPFIAAAFSLMNSFFHLRGSGDIGVATPYLYSVLANKPGALHDITAGTSCWQGPDCGTPGSGTYPATAGYDLATGIGTPNLGLMANALIPLPGATSIAIYRPSAGLWLLHDQIAPGGIDRSFVFGGGADDIPLMCDWMGSGQKNPVIFRPSTGVWLFGTNNTAPQLGMTAIFGQPGDKPVCGDWTGKGYQTIGVFRSNGTFNLSDSNIAPNVDHWEIFGQAGDTPLVGDWTGTGTEKIGIRRNALFVLAGSNATFPTTAYAFSYGSIGDQPITGDWDHNRTTTVGTYRPAAGAWLLSNTLPARAMPDTQFTFGGAAGDIAVVWR